jgi:hypothetical protein
VERGDCRVRVAIGKDDDRFHKIVTGHGAIDTDRSPARYCRFRQFPARQRDLALMPALAAGEIHDPFSSHQLQRSRADAAAYQRECRSTHGQA